MGDEPRKGDIPDPDEPRGPQSPTPTFGPGSPGYGPGAATPPQAPSTGPQAPAGPQSPAPSGATAPSPPGPEFADPPPRAPSYGGPVPPGGWDQPAVPAAAPPAPSHHRLAGWGSRFGAAVLDGLILFVPVLLLVAIVVAVALSSEVGGIVVGIIATLAFLLASLFYAPVLMARDGAHNGQTFGKQIVGIRVVRDHGRPFDLGHGFLREFVVKGLLFNGLGQVFIIPPLLNYLWPLWDDQNRALHDMIVSTHVVRA